VSDDKTQPEAEEEIRSRFAVYLNTAEIKVVVEAVGKDNPELASAMSDQFYHNVTDAEKHAPVEKELSELIREDDRIAQVENQWIDLGMVDGCGDEMEMALTRHWRDDRMSDWDTFTLWERIAGVWEPVATHVHHGETPPGQK
jgi:hypothetical protein